MCKFGQQGDREWPLTDVILGPSGNPRPKDVTCQLGRVGEIWWMKIIYNGEKRTNPWGLIWNVGFGLVVAAMAIKAVFGAKEIETFGTIFAILIGGVGLWLSWSALRDHLTLPLEMNIMDSGAIQVRPRSGALISLAATQFKRIRYLYQGSEGTLLVKADTHAWSLPVSEREANEFIATLLALNPQIEVERKEDNTSA
jgi:hypothetical protein